MCAEPKVDDRIFVELTPHVQDGHHHRIHQERDPHEESDNHRQDPVENQHKEIIRRSSVENSGFKSQTKKNILINISMRDFIKGSPVIVQEIKIDQKVEPGLRTQWVVEKGCDWTPNVEPRINL